MTDYYTVWSHAENIRNIQRSVAIIPGLLEFLCGESANSALTSISANVNLCALVYEMVTGLI